MMVTKVDMEYHEAIVFTVVENKMCKCIITVDRQGYIRDVMFSDWYDKYATEILQGVIDKLKELCGKKIIPSIIKVETQICNEPSVYLLQDLGFILKGKEWIYSLV